MSIKTETITHRVCDCCDAKIPEAQGFHFDEMLSDGSRIEVVTPKGERKYLAMDQKDFCGVDCATRWFERMIRRWL